MALVANTAPVAFGAIAIPIVTLSGLTDIPKEDLGAMVGRQTPLLALFVPLILVGMVDGWRGVRAVWPAAMVGGVSFAIGQFACSNYVSVELTDIVASLLSVAAMVLFLRVWQPGRPAVAERRTARGAARDRGRGDAPTPAHEARFRRREGSSTDSRRDVIGAYAPYVIIIVVFGARPVGAGQGLRWPRARPSSPGRGWTAQRQGRAADAAPTSSTGSPRRARCC